MHTFFVNTASELVDADTVSRFLFSNLRQNNLLICLNRDIGELAACAYDIVDLIDKDVQIGDEFNVIVYVNVRERENELCAAWVYERIALTVINENLASILHSRGKTARHICTIFGELFDRENQFFGTPVFLSETYGLLWERAGLPNAGAVHGIINSVKARAPQSKGDALAWLTEGFTGLLKDNGKKSLIGRETYLFRTIVNAIIEIIAIKISGGYEIELFGILENAFTVISNEQKNRYASKFSSIPFRVNDADVHKLNRCAYRLYLYVYRCAAFSEIIPYIPEVRWDAFARILSGRIAVMKKERGQIQKIDFSFPFLNIEAIGGTESEFKYDSAGIFPIDEDIPDFTADCKLTTSVSVRKLRAIRDAAIKDINKKNKENADKLDRFVRHVTKQFNDDKEGVFREKRNDYRKLVKKISNPEQSEIDVNKWKKSTDDSIAGQQDLLTADVNFREQIEEAQAKTEHCLESIEQSRPIWLIFSVVMLVFLIPYVSLQYRELAYPYGGRMFALSIAVVAFVFCASYMFFIFRYKRLIVKTLKKLRDGFNISQRQKAENAKIYKQRLTHYIPRSIILRQYYDDLVKFQKDKTLLKQLYLYHMNRLKAFENYMENLLRNLDINAEKALRVYRDDLTYQYILNPQSVKEDVTAVTRLYTVVGRDNIKHVLREVGDHDRLV